MSKELNATVRRVRKGPPDAKAAPAHYEDIQTTLAKGVRWKLREIDDRMAAIRDLFNAFGKSDDMVNALVNLEQSAMWARKHVQR